MKIQITTDHYDFILTSERDDVDNISDIFSRMATVITELQITAEEAKPVVINKE